MANIDWPTLAVGALIGVGCKKQLKAASRVAANMAATLASTTAQAVAEIAEGADKQPTQDQKKENG